MQGKAALDYIMCAVSDLGNGTEKVLIWPEVDTNVGGVFKTQSRIESDLD